ncbi:MAG: hypothetical protein IT174_10570 [Acidobacteria bacterium]|nr:hypothetical protein [Acidobacteriota bacterium]
MGIANRKEAEGMISVTSIVSGRTFEPLVQIDWGDLSAQLGLREAREHALGILEAAEAAESDAFVFQWITRDIVGTSQDEKDNWRQIIEEFKQFRSARRKDL